ncbi:Cytidine deaminase [Polaribacter huanghezhanensis]|jgi:cytidine deaminase|uniref:cytidine deaminase n=1 Tax=Polaribacter huanghezhanensis TaxID=1354726 RepID=UPI002649DAB9|nr:cytidine deaminase [Polaribacter huanghezhanensis]WKD86127.1 Cytidine deaminase [Polaribacter huanghezhanensis]
MKKIDVVASATVYDDVSELPSNVQLLMNKAIEARNNAYAPYSKFSVGAAMLLENNQIILGNNQESAAYPSGMCAERVAIWKAGSDFPGVKVKQLAITASSSISKVDRPVGPCGACRQTLSEYEINQKEPIEIYFMGEVGKIVKTESLLSLLPFSFDSTYL